MDKYLNRGAKWHGKKFSGSASELRLRNNGKSLSFCTHTRVCVCDSVVWKSTRLWGRGSATAEKGGHQGDKLQSTVRVRWIILGNQGSPRYPCSTIAVHSTKGGQQKHRVRA